MLEPGSEWEIALDRVCFHCTTTERRHAATPPNESTTYKDKKAYYTPYDIRRTHKCYFSLCKYLRE